MPKREKGAAVVATLFVWGLAGALFGSLFAGLHQVLWTLGLPDWQAVILGAGAAAMTTSAFYSAMPVALLGAMAGVLASMAYLVASGHDLRLVPLSIAAAAAGFVVGGLYAWMARGSERPLAHTATGLLSGLAAGGVLSAVLALYPGAIGMFVRSAAIVGLVGSAFTLSRRCVVAAFSGHCPRLLSAPVVGALIGAVVGAGIWIVGGAADAALDASSKGAIDQVLAQVPAGFLGGMLGGAVTGVLLELAGIHPNDEPLV